MNDRWWERWRPRPEPARTTGQAIAIAAADIRANGECIMCCLSKATGLPDPDADLYRRAITTSFLKFLPGLETELGFPCVVELGPPPFARVVPL